MWTPPFGGPDWTPITPKTGSFLHADSHSNLVKAFTDNIINPLIAAAQGSVKGSGLGWQLVNGGGDGTYLNLGAFISAIIYFIIFMTVVYFAIVVPYKFVMARMGKTVFGDPSPTKTC